MSAELTRTVEFLPAFDKRNDPKGNFGVHGVEMRFLLKGEKGVIQFLVFTNWHLPHVEAEYQQKSACQELMPFSAWYRSSRPIAADIGYHSLTPRYEGQEATEGTCKYLDGRPCYYDGSCLNATRFFDLLVREGSEAVWRAMEQWYATTFKTEAVSA